MVRDRSVRSGTPVSARAAARKPVDASADDDAKAELHANLAELRKQVQQAEQAQTESQKQNAVLQVRLDEALKEQGVLEEQVHEQTERVEELENERRESVRARRELEQIYESERVAAMREREEAGAREEELQGVVGRLREAVASRERGGGLGVEEDRRASLSRAGSFRSSNAASPNPEVAAAAAGGGQFAPPSSLQRSDSRSSSRLVMQKDKIIESLRMEVAEAQIKLVELENKDGGRLHALEREMYDVKVQNARLMEENESFQLLLSEKTLNGDLAQSELLRAPSNAGGSRPPSSRSPVTQGASLADELEEHESVEGEGGEGERKLQAEVNSLKDQNKALTLYINNIISRLLQHEQFETILDKTPDLIAGPNAASRRYAAADTEKDLPPPPPPKDDKPLFAAAAEEPQQSGAAGLLQRARSVMGGTKKPRPQSVIQPPPPQQQPDEPRVIENPDTAPRIPLARSASSRGSSGHRRANSEWPAASVVTSMYKGPSPGLQGPASPGLGSPTGSRGSFFGPAAGLGGSRVPSGSTVPTISESENGMRNKENETSTFPPRDSKIPAQGGSDGMRSPRHSVVSEAASGPPTELSSNKQPPPTRRPESTDSALLEPANATNQDALSNPSSPPRSTTSSGDRDANRPSGAIMMGSKPRPLRLVQEAQQDEEKTRKAANRGSWFGWMNKSGAGAAPGVGGGRSVSGGEQQQPLPPPQ